MLRVEVRGVRGGAGGVEVRGGAEAHGGSRGARRRAEAASRRVSRRMACTSLHICKISLFSLLDFV